MLALLDMHGADDALLWREDPRAAGHRRQIADDGLLAGVLGDEEEGDDGEGSATDEPDHQPHRHRLHRHHPAPLPVLLLEFDDFLAEQGGFDGTPIGSLRLP
ncbi:hypothetical protein ACFQU2_02095 [Siccirubricoccus deserti]